MTGIGSLGASAEARFADNEPRQGEEYYADLLRACRDEAAPECPSVMAAVERAREEMWGRWQRLEAANPSVFSSEGEALSAMKVHAFGEILSVEELRCMTEMKNNQLAETLRSRCASLVAARKQARDERRAGANEVALRKLEQDLSGMSDDASIARRCADSDLRRMSYDAETTSTPLFKAIDGRCTHAQRSAEASCEARVRPLLDGGNHEGALAAARAGFCSATTYSGIIDAFVARPAQDGGTACRQLSELQQLDPYVLDQRTRDRRSGWVYELEGRCHPEIAEARRRASESSGSGDPYGRAPLMLSPGGGGTAPSTSSPTRTECGSFSESGQRSTYYQTHCR